MSMNELKRLEIVTKVIEKRLTQMEAAGIVGVSVRQLKRLVKQFRTHKELGLVSKKKGAIGNHRLPEGLKEFAISLIIDIRKHPTSKRAY